MSSPAPAPAVSRAVVSTRPLLRVAVRSLALVVAVFAMVSGGGVAAASAADAVPQASAAVAAPVGERAIVPSDVQDFTFSSVDVDYTLTRDEDGTSRVRVVESFVAVFPESDQNRGLQRRIPQSFGSTPVHPELVSVTNENGEARPVETDTDDGHLIVTSRADDYLHGRQVFVITYDLVNPVLYFDDVGAQEFNVDVNGVDWAQPFGLVTATLTLDAALADDLTGNMACYRGAQGSTDTCDITSSQVGDDIVIRASAADLGPRQTMTIAVGFRDGTFEPFDPSFLASPWGWIQGGAVLALGGSIVWAGIVRGRKLKDEPGRPTVIAEYTPPDGIDALESAVLLHRTSKAIPAEVLEQAVVGSIRIVETGSSPRKAKLEAHLVDPRRADGDGKMLLAGLFGVGALTGSPDRTVYRFGTSDTRLSSTATKILKEAKKQLTEQGLWRKVPTAARAWPILLGFVALLVTAIAGAVAVSSGVAPPLAITLIVVGAFAIAAVCVLLARQPLTAKGAEIRDHLEGLKTFIDWAEADRISMLQSPRGAERRPIDVNDSRQMLHLYETLLPYAVVFGQEKKWAQQLAVYYGDDGNPGWYSGTTAFNAAAFSSGISTLSSSASASVSSSGGSTGGGSAGGGGGGGGGGGV